MQPTSNPSQFNEAAFWRGTWSAVATYDKGEAVFYNGSSYICLQYDVTTTVPGTDGTKWALLAQGDDGTGVVDHGLLTGLGDDDHPQYHTAAEVAADIATHAGLADPHTGYRLESAGHSHQSAGLEAGQLDHGLALTGLGDDDHPQYLKEEASGGTAAEVPDHTHASGAQAGTIAHSVLTGVGTGDHHAQSHSGGDHTNAAAASTQAFGDAATTGTQANPPARDDHKHAMPANPVVAHEAAGDPHTGYRLESADHSHASTGLQAGTIDHGAALTGLSDDDHPQYLKEEASGGTAAEVPDHTHASAAQAGTVAHSALTGITANDHHTQVHGAADHTDGERLMYFDCREHMVGDLAANVDLGAAPAIVKVRTFADAANHGTGMQFPMPSDYVAGSAVGVEFVIAGDGSAAANVRFRLTHSVLEVGDTLTEAGTDILFTQAVAAETNLFRVTTRQNFTPTGLDPGDMLRLWFYRLGSDGADTYLGALRVVGMKFYYTSAG